MTIVNNDYIEVNGPASLADLLSALDPSGTSTTQPGDELAAMELGGDVYAQVQYDAVDSDSWPYMIVVQARTDDLRPVRLAAQRLLESVRAAGWSFRMTSDADDSLLIESSRAQ